MGRVGPRVRGRDKLSRIPCNRDTHARPVHAKHSPAAQMLKNAMNLAHFPPRCSQMLLGPPGVSGEGGGPPNVRGFMKSDEKHRVLSSNMFVSVLNFLCIPQIGRLPAHGPNVKRLLIPRSVFLSGLLRIEEIEKAFLTEMSKKSVFQKISEWAGL